ncbi:MAG: thiamine pyrophosphate-dependent enzyme, partial [Thermoplasmatales archaeon]|nr:thiamine pyrophosphate-dependent enzyme [Thermoplasmatales archaeon]
IDGPFPYSCLKIPIFHTAFETAASTASGVSAAMKVKGKKTTVLAWAGDGGTFDIGIQALSGAAERNDNIIYICYDNEAYMNTGNQRSSATPYGAWTTTTPGKKFKSAPKKNMVEIMVAHKISYTATACIAYPEDFIKKVKKAKDIMGTKYIQVLAPCPTGWRYDPAKTIEISKMAVESGVYPIYEVENGVYKINRKVKNKTVKEYIKMQKRFGHLTDEIIDEIQKNVDREWELLLRKEEFYGHTKK